MDKHRTRFLASLSARLERDRALREREGETPSLWHRHPEPPDSAAEPAAEEFPEADLSDDILDPTERTTRAEVVAIRGSAGRRSSKPEPLRGQEPDRAPPLAVPWSETGMSPALRDAIASVRRVSHHTMPERPLARADRGRYAPRFEDAAVEQASFDLAESDVRPLFEEQELREEARFDRPMPAERFDDQALDEESPPADTYTDPGASGEAATADEWSARSADRASEPASLAEDAPHEDRRFGDEQDSPLPFVARRARSSSGVRAARTAPFDEDGTDEEPWFDDREDEDSLPGLQEAARDRAPARRGVPQRPRLHLAALVLAPLFVLVAALGLGILSGAQGFDRVLTSLGWTSLADGSIGAPPTQPAPPAATSASSSTSDAEPPPAASVPSAAGGAAALPEPAPSPRLSELETVRVAPLPAPPNPEQSPADPGTSDLPLPPPPKPAPWSSRSGEASGPSDPIESAADTGAVALPPADRTANDPADTAVASLETDGAGDPFEPILIKSSVSEPRVFVHYTERAPGSHATALRVLRQLRAAGFKVEERPVEVTIANNSIRYFFPGDRDKAEALSAQLQSQAPGTAAVTILDLTSYEPKPRQGHLEVWLRG